MTASPSGPFPEPQKPPAAPEGTPRRDSPGLLAAAALRARMNTVCELDARTRQLEATVATLQATLESSREGILVTDEGGRVTMANSRFDAFWALTSPVRGKHRDEVAGLIAPYLATESAGAQLLSCEDGVGDACLYLADGRVLEQRSRPQYMRGGEAAGRVWTFLDVTQQHRAARDLRDEATALELVNRVELEVLREVDTGKLLQSIVQACLQVGGAEYAAFFALEAASGCLQVLAYAGPHLPRLDMNARIPPTRLFRATLERRRIVRLSDVGRAGSQSKAPHPMLRSYLAVPVIARDGTVAGALMLGHSRAGVFGERAQRLASGLGASAAIALDNAKMLSTLEDRVEERTRALSIANRDLEAFAFSVSHDLRSPLGRVDGYAQALASSLPDAQGKPAHYLERIRGNIQKMGVMIESSLALAKLSFAPMRTEDVDLSAIAMRICRELAEAEPARNVRVDIQPGMRVKGDATLLDVMLGNLLRNSWKFTAPRKPGTIAFRRVASEHGGPMAFEVVDNGVGFEGQSSERLFVPFQRFHADDEFPGTGIGLATVRRLVERHGGRIYAESAPDQGCRFEFTLVP